MKRVGCKFGSGITGAVNGQKGGGGGAVVSQLVPKLKESVPPWWNIGVSGIDP